MTEAAKQSLPAGWYASTNGEATQQYWDGTKWTGRFQPMPRPTLYATGRTKPTSHAFHLIMTIITMGLWLPIWIIVAISNSSKRE